MKERLQKLLANAGLGSRREIEGWIKEGRVTVNGEVATIGLQASLEDRIKLDKKPLRLNAALSDHSRVLLYHKPVGEICSRSDPQNRPTIYRNIPSIKQGRWLTVGRLDFNTSGVLLLTNDGELANRLMHPSNEVEREYAVRIMGQVTEEMLIALKEGVELDDGIASFDSILDAGGKGSNHWYHVILREGRTREVRRLWESQGVTVSRLIRVRYGKIELDRSLRPGKFRGLMPDDVNGLRRLVGLPEQEIDTSFIRRVGRKARDEKYSNSGRKDSKQHRRRR